MTRDDIIRMAREAGLIPPPLDWPQKYAEALERFAALVIANHPPQSYMTWQEGFAAGKQTEREACAKVCEMTYEGAFEGVRPCFDTAQECAAAIRARGTRAEPPFIDPRGSLGEPIV